MPVPVATTVPHQEEMELTGPVGTGIATPSSQQRLGHRSSSSSFSSSLVQVTGGEPAEFGVFDGQGCPGGADSGGYSVAINGEAQPARCEGPGRHCPGLHNTQCLWSVPTPGCARPVVAVTPAAEAATVASCSAQSGCLQWTIGDCDGYGKRRVCMARQESDTCSKASWTDIAHACSLDGTRFKVRHWGLHDRRTVCYEVVGGSSAEFAVFDGQGCPGGADNADYTVTVNSRPQVAQCAGPGRHCSGLHSGQCKWSIPTLRCDLSPSPSPSPSVSPSPYRLVFFVYTDASPSPEDEAPAELTGRSFRGQWARRRRGDWGD